MRNDSPSAVRHRGLARPALRGRRRRRRGLGLVELLIVIVLIAVLFAVLSSTMTGTGGSPGVKEQAERTMQQVNFRSMHQLITAYGLDHDGRLPSTRIESSMPDDTAGSVFAVLVDYGMPPSMLVSPNEVDDDITVGAPGSIDADHVSWAIQDYEADDWKRERMWRLNAGANAVLLSDRWLEDPPIEGMHNVQDGFWHVLFTDGSATTTESGALPNGDSLFDPDPSFGDSDNLMVHD